MTMGCPETYEEAINSNESEKWKEAMKGVSTNEMLRGAGRKL